MSQLVQTRNDIRISNNPYLLIEATMIKLARLDEIDDISHLIAQIKQGGTAMNAVPTAVTPTASAPPSMSPIPKASAPRSSSAPNTPKVQTEDAPQIHKLEPTEENLKKYWQELSIRISKSSKIAGLAFKAARFAALRENAIVARLDSITNHNAIKTHLERIEAIIADVFDKPLKLILELDEKETPTKVEIIRKTIDNVKEEIPELKSFIEQTDARLI
jgi:lambda repressor-like predicted transcriptional regulator